MSWLDGRGQLEVVSELIGVVRRGLQAELEPLVWTVGMTGVTGEVENLAQPSAIAGDVFDRWVKLLGAVIRPAMPSNPDPDGDIVRVAHTRLRPGPFAPTLVLRLKLHGFVLDSERRTADGR